MPSVSKKLIYAVEAVLDIAYNAAGTPVQSSEISKRQGIPPRYLEPVLQQLVREGILTGVRGPRGGYRLARERRRTTLGDITRVVQSLETADNPLAEESASDLGERVVRPMWRRLQTEWMERLDGITIEDLCAEARRSGVESEIPAKLDFSI